MPVAPGASKGERGMQNIEWGRFCIGGERKTTGEQSAGVCDFARCVLDLFSAGQETDEWSAGWHDILLAFFGQPGVLYS